MKYLRKRDFGNELKFCLVLGKPTTVFYELNENVWFFFHKIDYLFWHYHHVLWNPLCFENSMESGIGLKNVKIESDLLAVNAMLVEVERLSSCM